MDGKMQVIASVHEKTEEEQVKETYKSLLHLLRKTHEQLVPMMQRLYQLKIKEQKQQQESADSWSNKLQNELTAIRNESNPLNVYRQLQGLLEKYGAKPWIRSLISDDVKTLNTWWTNQIAQSITNDSVELLDQALQIVFLENASKQKLFSDDKKESVSFRLLQEIERVVLEVCTTNLLDQKQSSFETKLANTLAVRKMMCTHPVFAKYNMQSMVILQWKTQLTKTLSALITQVSAAKALLEYVRHHPDPFIESSLIEDSKDVLIMHMHELFGPTRQGRAESLKLATPSDILSAIQRHHEIYRPVFLGYPTLERTALQIYGRFAQDYLTFPSRRDQEKELFAKLSSSDDTFSIPIKKFY